MSHTRSHSFSFEFFPTKTDAGHEKLLATARCLAEYKPDFFSCTYGAGGSTRDRTLNTVLQLDGEVKVSTAPHLSCVGGSKQELRELLNLYKDAGIKRIVALRGDHAKGQTRFRSHPKGFKISIELISALAKTSDFTLREGPIPKPIPKPRPPAPILSFSNAK